MRDTRQTLVVALSGGIGCGQSTVAKFFERFGAKVINADLMARRIVNQDAAVREEIKKTFGKRYFYRNGRLNRRLLGKDVFDNPAKLHKLNRIVHPRLVERMIEEIELARDSSSYDIIAVDAALVYEIHLEKMFDAVIVVASRLKNRIQRVQARDGLSEKEIRDRIDRQIPIEEKVKWAEYTIHNNTSLQKLEQKSRGVYNRLLRRLKK